SEVTKWVKYQLDSRAHPEQAYNLCLGVLNLSKTYSNERLNNACAIANQHKLYRYRQISDILKSNQDKLVNSKQQSFDLPQHHENVRGSDAFH
ncbi:IS21 family transposase, partial [Parashewanella curva]